MAASLPRPAPAPLARPPAEAELAVDIQNLFGRYRRAERDSIEDVSLVVRKGALLGLLGPNGAGKTTLLSMLCALMRPRSGSIAVHGLRFAEAPDAYKDLIGLAPQSLALYPRLTARENLETFGRLSGLSGARLRERVAFGLEFAGLQDLAHRRVETYSGGQQRRLNLATTLLPDPPVLVLDEPTVGIDPQSRHAIHENLRALNRAGKTIIYTSHYLDEVEQLCDEIAVLDGGRLIAQGALGALLARFTGNRIELRFDPRAVAAAADILRTMAGVEDVAVRSPLLTLITDDPYRRLPAILKMLAHVHIRPLSVAVGARDLEQAFLALTGTQLRDGS